MYTALGNPVAHHKTGTKAPPAHTTSTHMLTPPKRSVELLTASMWQAGHPSPHREHAHDPQQSMPHGHNTYNYLAEGTPYRKVTSDHDVKMKHKYFFYES